MPLNGPESKAGCANSAQADPWDPGDLLRPSIELMRPMSHGIIRDLRIAAHQPAWKGFSVQRFVLLQENAGNAENGKRRAPNAERFPAPPTSAAI
jgi:hypothetical protein